MYTLIEAVDVAQLERANQENIGRDVAHALGIGQRRVFDGRALRTYAHPDSGGLSGFRQPLVEHAGLRRAAGHWGDQQGSRQPLAQQRGGSIHIFEVQVWQRTVDETVALKAVRDLIVFDVFLDIDAEVIGFAFLIHPRVT